MAGGSITLRTQVDEGLLVQGNPTKLREVLTNLIFNAVDALPQGGLIQITAEARESAVLLVVRDTGAGMTAATEARIFEPFFTTKVAGSGLGLAVVKDIIESHGGAIRVVSQLSGGTAFTITLPAATAPSAPLAPPAALPRRGSARILAVDDDAGLVDMLRAMLAVGGYHVTVATSGAEAVRLFEQQPFDVVCTDLGMPGMNGWEVARHVRARAPQTPVILITGWGTALDPDELAAGTVGIILPEPYRVVGRLGDRGPGPGAPRSRRVRLMHGGERVAPPFGTIGPGAVACAPLVAARRAMRSQERSRNRATAPFPVAPAYGFATRRSDPAVRADHQQRRAP